MKKIITLLVVMVVLTVSKSNAQEGAYLNVYGGYYFPGASTTDWTASTVADVDSNAFQVSGGAYYADYTDVWTEVNGTFINNTNWKPVNLNLGKGLNFGVSFGYMFNDHFGAELGIGYFLGSKNTFEQSFTDSLGNNTSFKGEMSANQIRFNPMLVVSSDFKDFMPYAKFGLVIGVGTKITEKYDDVLTPGTIIAQEFTSKGGLSLGANAVLGALYQFNKKTGIFLEMQVTAMAYSPKERELTAYTINGNNELAADKFPRRARVTEYVKEVTTSSSEPDNDPTLSTLATKIKYPFSTFALNLGLRFSF